MRTLGEFIVAKQNDFPMQAVSIIPLSSIRLAAKIVNREINKAGLVEHYSAVGTDNVQGEEQQNWSLYARTTSLKLHLKPETKFVVLRVKEEDEALPSIRAQQKRKNTSC
ncbi:hypothetical protein O9992_06980 [Vibrio lentus]|nr:hypothetical protein [Vibrio lentus]